jgi:hypothetical protein
MQCCAVTWMRRRSNVILRGILARLVDEQGGVGLSYFTVRDHVRKPRRKILAEAGWPLELVCAADSSAGGQGGSGLGDFSDKNPGRRRAAGQAGRTRTNCQDHGMYRIGPSSRRAAHLTLLGIASGG